MNGLSSFLTVILGISIAVERIVEILKGWTPNFWLFKTNPIPTREAQRGAWIHVLSGFCGALIAHGGHIKIFEGIDPGGWISSVSGGLLASGGSAFWNHALDILKATKVQQEQSAKSAVANTNKDADAAAVTL
jgi:hypothetical protein